MKYRPKSSRFSVKVLFLPLTGLTPTRKSLIKRGSGCLTGADGHGADKLRGYPMKTQTQNEGEEEVKDEFGG
jgi:hypothetical protein